MDDLLDNFANHNIETPNNDSPSEDEYKYHFVNGSPAASEHDRPVNSAAATSAGPSNQKLFFNIEASTPQPTTGRENEDEGDYNADIDDDDDDDDDDFERGRERASRFDVYQENVTMNASDNGKSLFVNNTYHLSRSFRTQNRRSLESNDVEKKIESDDVEPYPALSNDEHESDDFKQQLRKFHRQDCERDELLAQLHQENLDLKSILKESVPGSNSRAEAAERSLFEIRKSLDNSPYVCVLIDAKGYKVHEDLLQLGKQGGIEAADRLRNEVSIYLQQFGEAKSWGIMVHLYIDVGGLLARCVSNHIPLSDSCVRGFMLGFTQAQPLFTIADVGRDQEKLIHKVEAMLHLFVNNTQCKHVIFGCCHDASYVATLEKYACNPIMASSITLLKSYEVLSFFKGLPFDSVEFPSVFRSTPYKITDRLAEDIDDVQDLQQRVDFDLNPQKAEDHTAKGEAARNEAITKWQATTNTSWPVLAPTRPPPSGWVTENKVLLNINEERVDQEQGEIDYETSESMLDRIEVRRFCLFYHLHGSCDTNLAGKPCNFRHEPRLNKEELRFLMRDSRRKPCSFGSRCRRPDCLYGHVCPDQPGCEKGSKCSFYKFHGVDKTVVKVWSSEKRLSPRKNGWRA